MMHGVKFVWNWPSGSVEDGDMKNLQRRLDDWHQVIIKAHLGFELSLAKGKIYLWKSDKNNTDMEILQKKKVNRCNE